MYDVINNLYHLILSLQMESENVPDRSNNISVSIGLQNVMDRYGTDQKAIRYNGNIASYALVSFSDYEAFSPIHLCSTWQSHAQGLIIAKLSLQRSVWLILIKKWKVERTNTSYDGFFFFFWNFMNICADYFILRSLSLLVDVPELRYIYNFSQSFEMA